MKGGSNIVSDLPADIKNNSETVEEIVTDTQETSTTAHVPAFSTVSANETETTTIPPTISTPQRNLVGYVKCQPGYSVTIFINLTFLINGIGALILCAVVLPTRGPISPDEYYSSINIFGIFLFCSWNYLVWSCILLFPAITTVKREQVHGHFFIPNLMAFAFLFSS